MFVVCYLTIARLVYGTCHHIRGLLSRGCAVDAASLLEARTGGARDQPRAARELSCGVLPPTERFDEFQDLQPRDVDRTLSLCVLDLLLVGDVC
jgi:hypothetical protein